MPLGAATDMVLRSAVLLDKGRSSHQSYEVWDTPDFGRVYLLDGRLMAAEAVASYGHEALIHPVALAHPEPRTALVLGGGDGGSARELIRHPCIEAITVVELDDAVVALARRYLPAIHDGAFENGRVRLIIGDAHAHVLANAESVAGVRYDLIVFDLTDPDGTAAALHEASFFAACKACLRPGGAIVVQLGSPHYHRSQVVALVARLAQSFACVRPYLSDVPVYGGAWAFASASDALDPSGLDPVEIERRVRARGLAVRHYNGNLHRAQFALPTDLQTALRAALSNPQFDGPT